jgi:chitin synthase
MTPVLCSEGMVVEYGKRRIDTLHLKNLLSLGEDRYLTTLILKSFPDMRTKYVSDAVAQTSAPSSWSVLLSQRRRWINSTIHNLMELAVISELKSLIRFVVLVDLFSTLLSPIGFIYLVYLFVILFTQESISIPILSILLLITIYGLQILLFLFKAQFANIGWMILYLLAMPIFSFILPLYSFWRMDNFSWGSTRMVVQDEESEFDFISKDKEGMVIESIFKPHSIPLKTWAEYIMEGGELGRRIQRDFQENRLLQNSSSAPNDQSVLYN